MASPNSLEAFSSYSSFDKAKRFTYEDLKNFTSDFSNEIGVGGFSKVYKGKFSNGKEVAVKVLTEKSAVKEVFMAELKTVLKASHSNLVKLYGFCFADNMKALVYEYMIYGSLDTVLFEKPFNIKWETLYSIMIETAKGISHLHDGCTKQIIHTDIKPANVLLDWDFSPKVTDFGLAKLLNRDNSHFTLTGIRGTPGYVAPEAFMASSVVTYKCDVYSFGMMLFEVLGMRPNNQNGQWFPHQVWEKFENDRLDEIIDDCGIEEDDRGRAKILSMVALWCIQFTPELRPSMSTVVEVLEKEIHVTVPPNPFYPSTSVTSMRPSQDPNINESEDPDVDFRYIEAAVKSGQIEEVERVTRESNFYDPEKTKNFLMESKLLDARPLINVCSRFGFISDLTHYFYKNNMLQDIEDYIQKVNPMNAPLVVGKLLDDECPEDFIKGLLLPVGILLPVEPLVQECEKRNRLGLLTQLLQYLVNEGSEDVHVHNAFGKIIIDSNSNPEHFLTDNPYYDSLVLGKYCENQLKPTLAFVAYRRGQCEDELINITNIHSLFQLLAEYVVQRMDPDLWRKVLEPEDEYRTQLISQIVSAVMPENKSPEEISATVKAFITADLSVESIELLECLVFKNPAFQQNFILQNLLILSAIKVHHSNVKRYVYRLNNFDGHAVGEVAVEAKLYEEAHAIFTKFNLNVQAVDVLLNHIKSIERAEKFAARVRENAVWSLVEKARDNQRKI